MLKVRCKLCNVELESHPIHTRCCGCDNLTTVTGDKISALDLSQVVMVDSPKEVKKTSSLFSEEELAWQESRKQRKVRKLTFEIR